MKPSRKLIAWRKKIAKYAIEMLGIINREMACVKSGEYPEFSATRTMEDIAHEYKICHQMLCKDVTPKSYRDTLWDCDTIVRDHITEDYFEFYNMTEEWR